MHSDHFAIVIGLRRYLRLGDPPPADLEGPENDADAVVDWLSADGGVPLENIKIIRSRDFNSPPDAAPSRDLIEKAFLWLDELAGKNQEAGKRRKVGTRLYLYVSGHGFSPRYRQGCLLAGDAAERQFSANVFPTAWIDWLQDAEYFREYVLWMDCCMDRQVLTQPTPPPLDPIGGGEAPGPSFIAFAAPRPLKAAEKEIPEDHGRWHGVFTWNLLQGLRGAAANSFGMVTGRSLADWLRQSQLAWLEDADRRNPDVAKEPAIVDENEALIFARGLAPSEFNVRLRFPTTMVGNTARIWSGVPPKPGEVFSIAADVVTMRLRPGLYLAEVPGAGLRHGFAITRPMDIILSETGTPPTETVGLFGLSINPNDPTADIRLAGDAFRSVDTGAGTLESKLPYGLYQIRIRIGRQIVEKVILLDSDWPRPSDLPSEVRDLLPQMPEITSAAPLPGTRATHEYHISAAKDGQNRIDINAGEGAQLMVMARTFSVNGVAIASRPPWDGVTVVDSAGKIVADLSKAGEQHLNEDPVSVCTISLAPGAYELGYPAGTIRVAQSLILPPGGWRLEAYLMHTLNGSVSETRPRISLMMRRIGAPWGTEEDARLEKARVALADERAILSDELSDLLIRKFDNPLAGIIGGHLLLISNEQSGRGELDLLNVVVKNLRNIVGPGHPDVEALSLACPDPTLRTTISVVSAPLFERSWRMLVKGTQVDAQLIPLALWKQVHATLTVPPFLIWSTDSSTQNEVRKALTQAVFAPRTAVPLTVAGNTEIAPSVDIFRDLNYAISLPTDFESTSSSVNRYLVTPFRAAVTLLRNLRRSKGTESPAAESLKSPVERLHDMRRLVERADALGLPRIALKALEQESKSENERFNE